MRIYLDASPIIYWVEKIAAYYPQVDARIKHAGVTLASSHLALMECLILPLRQGQSGLKQDYDDGKMPSHRADRWAVWRQEHPDG
jgi:hypothetical protein